MSLPNKLEMFPRSLPMIVVCGLLCVLVVLWICKGDLRILDTERERVREQIAKQHQFQTSSTERSRLQFTNATFSGKQRLDSKTCCPGRKSKNLVTFLQNIQFMYLCFSG